MLIMVSQNCLYWPKLGSMSKDRRPKSGTSFLYEMITEFLEDLVLPGNGHPYVSHKLKHSNKL